MSQPASNQSETSKLKQLLNGGVDDSIKSRLPRRNPPSVAVAQPQPEPDVIHNSFTADPEPEPRRRRYQFLPAFWTIASVMSFSGRSVNGDWAPGSCPPWPASMTTRGGFSPRAAVTRGSGPSSSLPSGSSGMVTLCPGGAAGAGDGQNKATRA